MRRQLSLTDRQRNGGTEDIIGIVVPLSFDEPLGVAAIAFRRTVGDIPGEEIRISTRKRHRLERLTSGSSPLTMPLLLELVRPIGKRGKNLDQHMVAAKAEAVASNATREAAPLNSNPAGA